MKNKKDVKPKKKSSPNRQLPLTPQADKAVKKVTDRPASRKKAEKLPAHPAPDIDEKLDNDKKALLNELSVLKAEQAIQNEKLKNALRKSEESYRLLLENVSESIYIIGRNFDITPVTPHLGKLLGYSPEESQGINLKDLGLLVPISLDVAISTLERVFSGETIPATEFQLTARDGTPRYQEISAAPLVRDGKVVAAVCVARDVTQRKLAE
ncbi:MAG: PAS domain S-box protein, partial [Chloroflexi bacterium]|nr:PAS domain S-box protein [Chloroflexota bacterium]